MARILILTGEFPPFRGGIGTYVLEMARAAASSGHDVTVLAPEYGPDDQAVDQGLNFSVRRYRATKSVGVRRLVYNSAILLKLFLSNIQFDVVHAAEWPFFVPLAWSGYRLTNSGRCVFTLHGTEIVGMATPRNARVTSYSGLYSGWGRFVANSKFTRQLALERLPSLDPGIISSVPLGVGEDWLEGQTPKEQARSELGIELPQERFVVLTVARVVPRKGHHLALEAIENLPIYHKQRLTWLIAGKIEDVAYATRLFEQARASGVDLKYQGSPDLSGIKKLMDAADLFFLTGIWSGEGAVEGFGLVFLEAASRGLPSLATGIGGVPDAIDHGITGLLAEPDPEALMSSLKCLMENADLLRVLGSGARERAVRSSWAKVVADTYLRALDH